MNLYYDTFRGRLRWYVKVNKTGRRIGITEKYSTDERSDFPPGVGGCGPCLGRSATYAPHGGRSGADDDASLPDQRRLR